MSSSSSVYRDILVKHINEYSDGPSIRTVEINSSIFSAIGCIPKDFLNGAGEKGIEAMVKYMDIHKQNFTDTLSPVWLNMYIAHIDAILTHASKEDNDATSKLDTFIKSYGGLCE
jgi:hypothetical protein